MATSIGASTDIPAQTLPATTTQGPDTTQPPKPYYDFDVKMTCGGCSGAIERVLKKQILQPNQFSVSLEDQTVKVWGPSLPSFKEVNDKIAKTGKEIRSAKEVTA